MTPAKRPEAGSHTPGLRLAALLGVTGVALGAHGLAPLLEKLDTEAIWKTASFYHLVHAVALLAVAAAGRATPWLVGLWTGGSAIFSGSLYLLAVTGVGWLGAITPIGGVALITGWAVLFIRGK